MKAIYISFVTLLFVVGTQLTANAQKAILKLNAFEMLDSKFGGALEYVVNDHFAINLGAAYINRSDSFIGEGDAQTVESGFNVTPEIRYYTGNRYNKAPKGIFAGGNIAYESLSLKVEGTTIDSLNLEGTVTNIGFGVVVGYQWIFQKRFSLELFYNPYFNTQKIDGDAARLPEDFYPPKEGLQVNRLGVSVGLVF